MATAMQTRSLVTEPPAERPCFWCNGSGRVPKDDEQRYEECSACEGSGMRETPGLERIAA
jgi:DnaJ-class molecular chaperone